MTEGAKPSITGIHHFSPTVTDVEASVAWYQRLFGMDCVPVPFPHYERDQSGQLAIATAGEWCRQVSSGTGPGPMGIFLV